MTLIQGLLVWAGLIGLLVGVGYLIDRVKPVTPTPPETDRARKQLDRRGLDVLEETYRRERARLGGWFWLPCPNCGKHFGGNEWGSGDESKEASIPIAANPMVWLVTDSTGTHRRLGPSVRSQDICPRCQSAGAGDRAWAEFNARLPESDGIVLNAEEQERIKQLEEQFGRGPRSPDVELP